MTVTIVLSDCPQKLRGDMTKWFIEINTGVYVGNVNARVRDALWDRIVENLGHGHATMIFTAAGEQHLDFRVHNAYWEPVDYDGIKLMRRPEHIPSAANKVLSNAKKQMIGAKKKSAAKKAVYQPSDYAVLDLETTGLDEKKDSIVEIGVVVVIQDIPVEKKQILIRAEKPLPKEIIRLTGITDSLLAGNGMALDDALTELLALIEDLPIVSHNAEFEHKFLDEALQKAGQDVIENRFIDTLTMSMRLLPEVKDHKLSTLAEYFNIAHPIKHRALPDSEATYAVYRELNELASQQSQNHEK